MVDYKGQQFENNPNGMNTNVQWEGVIYIKYSSEPAVKVYGFTQQQLVDIANQFKAIEPNVFNMEIYGPYDFLCIRREYVCDIMF